MAEKLEVVIDVTTDKAIKAAQDLAKQTAKLNSELDETASMADMVADALDNATDQMVADMKAADKAAESLGSALGPELAGKIGSAKLDAFIGDLRRAGLSFDDITANADRFADSLRRMDAAADSVGNVEQALVRTGDAADRSGGVMANFVGNAIQELPGLSGAFGPLNTAIGQFAEYAAEGGVSAQGFLKAAGPIAALGAGFALISTLMNELGKNQREVTEQSQKLLDVQRDLADARYATAAEKMVTQYGDMISAANDLGISTTDVVRSMQGQYDLVGELRGRYDDLIDRFNAMQNKNSDEATAVRLQAAAYNDLANQLDIAGKAYERSGDQNAATVAQVDELTKVLATQAGAVDDATSAQARHAEQVRAGQNAAQALLDTENALTEAYLRRNATVFDTERTQLELDNSYAALIASETEFQTTLGDGTKSAEDKAKALRDLRIQELNAADAVLSAAQDYSTAQGATENSSAAIAIQIDYLEKQRAKYPQLRDEIDKYIANLKKIPSDIQTRVTTVGGMRQYAAGTQFHPGGVALVGEQGPEIVDLPRGSRVFSASQSRNMARSGTINATAMGAPAGIVVNVLSADPDQVVEAIKRWQSRNGAAI